jgi:hypothetical protein
MRKLFPFLAIAFLFQSCFTYKSSDLTPDKMTAGKTYKIQRNNKYEKVTINRITDSSAIVTQRFEEKSIPLSEITKVKTRKFSMAKTVVYPIAAVAVVTGIFVLTYDGPEVMGGN